MDQSLAFDYFSGTQRNTLGWTITNTLVTCYLNSSQLRIATKEKFCTANLYLRNASFVSLMRLWLIRCSFSYHMSRYWFASHLKCLQFLGYASNLVSNIALTNTLPRQLQHDYILGNYPVGRDDAAQLTALQILVEIGFIDNPESCVYVIYKAVPFLISLFNSLFFIIIHRISFWDAIFLLLVNGYLF